MTSMPFANSPAESAAHTHLFEQQLALFDEVFSTADDSVRHLLLDVRASVVRLRQELNDIHISSLSAPAITPPACFDCGVKNLEVFYTSKHGGYHLCEACFHTRDVRGRVRCHDGSTDTVFRSTSVTS
ncbi:MAG: hypothetical protein ACREJU_02230 [Nitrospiraceae bacterium]